MKLIYTPAGGERREWTWRPAEVSSDEAELIEDALELPYANAIGQMLVGRIKARRAVLWTLLRRDDPGLRFEDVKFRVDEFSDDYDEDELAAMRAVDGDGDAAPEGAGAAIAAVEAGKDTAPAGATGSST